MDKKLYTIQYRAEKFYTINVEAESEEEALELAEEAYCDFDDHDWEEYEETKDADVIAVADL